MHSMIRILAVAALIAAASQTAVAQTTARKTLSLDGAKAVGAAAAAEARRLNAGGAIEKARTAATFRRPTSVFEEAIKNGRVSLVAVSVMTPLQGGVPVLVDGQVVGAIGVSGAASAQQDDDIAKVAAVALDRPLGAAR